MDKRDIHNFWQCQMEHKSNCLSSLTPSKTEKTVLCRFECSTIHMPKLTIIISKSLILTIYGYIFQCILLTYLDHIHMYEDLVMVGSFIPYKEKCLKKWCWCVPFSNYETLAAFKWICRSHVFNNRIIHQKDRLRC